MNELALFAGAGGGILGAKLLGWRTVCAVELDPYCREVLLRRQEEGFLPPFPIWDDIRTFDGRPWRGKVDVVTAGFPCQPFSSAGKQRGADDERNLWPETYRVLCEVRPRCALLENVPGLLAHGYIRRIFGDLVEGGFDAGWRVLSAAELGAPHRRDRLWIVANTESRRKSQFAASHAGCEGCRGKEEFGSIGASRRDRGRRSAEGATDCSGDSVVVAPDVADTDSAGLQSVCNGTAVGTCRTATPRATKGGAVKLDARSMQECKWWATEPDVGRVADELALGLDRLRTAGKDVLR